MDYNFRTLNYLGSKLRLLNFIAGNVTNITPNGTGVCDLFAGSGCVSYKLSKTFPVFSCDIQSYSQVICNALMGRFDISDEYVETFINSIDLEYFNELKDAFNPLIEKETTAIKDKDIETLTNILEHGSVEVYNIDKIISSLSNELQKVSENIENIKFNDVKSLISRYYGGVYFSYYQAIQIDTILNSIDNLIESSNKDLFLAALLSTASDVVDTVGKHFAQPIKARDSKGNIKNIVYNKAISDKTIDVFELYKSWLYRYAKLPKSSFYFKTIQTDYMDCLYSLPDSVKTIYADPPYTRDHYSRFYHVLETITLRDNPQLSTVTIHGETHISNGIYRNDRHQSPFCIKSKAPKAFKDMFETVSNKNRNLLLSYSPYDESKHTHPRVVTMQQLINLARECFDDVKTISAGGFKHNKLNSTEHFLEASDEAELLIICTNH